MCGTMLCIAAVTLGIDPGWERMEDGGWRYLIQIDPNALEDLKAGRIPPLESDIPPQLRDIRSYRISVGKGQPRRDPLPELPEAVVSPPGPAWPSPPEAPGPLPTATDVKPREERQASFSEQVLAKPQLAPPSDTGKEPAEPPRPWLPFTMALSAAFACFGGMLYLGWIAWDYRKRYRQLYLRFLESGLEMAGETG